jgi:hypothetical protein
MAAAAAVVDPGLESAFQTSDVRPWLGSAVTARSRDLPATMREQSREERNAEVRVFLKANLLSTRRHTSPPYGNDINDTHNCM